MNVFQSIIHDVEICILINNHCRWVRGCENNEAHLNFITCSKLTEAETLNMRLSGDLCAFLCKSLYLLII